MEKRTDWSLFPSKRKVPPRLIALYWDVTYKYFNRLHAIWFMQIQNRSLRHDWLARSSCKVHMITVRGKAYVVHWWRGQWNEVGARGTDLPRKMRHPKRRWSMRLSFSCLPPSPCSFQFISFLAFTLISFFFLPVDPGGGGARPSLPLYLAVPPLIWNDCDSLAYRLGHASIRWYS